MSEGGGQHRVDELDEREKAGCEGGGRRRVCMSE